MQLAGDRITEWKSKLETFERRTVTGSGHFHAYLGSGFAQIFGQILSIKVNTVRNTNSVASRHFKRIKASPPVDARR